LQLILRRAAPRLLCVLNRREFDGPIAHLKKFDESWIKSSLTWGRWPASYKTLTQLSIHLQHSQLNIVFYKSSRTMWFYINRPARSKAARTLHTPGAALLPAVRVSAGVC
jgi:hypothetical protein